MVFSSEKQELHIVAVRYGKVSVSINLSPNHATCEVSYVVQSSSLAENIG